LHKKNKKITYTKETKKSKNLSSNASLSKSESTLKNLNQRFSKYRKSSARVKVHSKSETSTNTKDPVTITIFAVMLAIKITKSILEHYTKKNLTAALKNLNAELDENTENAKIIQENEIKSCSSTKLVLLIAKHMYNITIFKMIYANAYMEFLKKQNLDATCENDKKIRKSRGCLITELVEQLENLRDNLVTVYPKILNNMHDNVRGACQENDLSEELINRNNAINIEINKIQGKIDENEGGILGVIMEGLFSDIEKESKDLRKINFKKDGDDDSSDADKARVFEDVYSRVASKLKLALDFKNTYKSIKELSEDKDPTSIKWTETIQTCLNFLASIVHNVNTYMNNDILGGVEKVINFVGSIIVLFGHIYAYRRENDKDKKADLKKKVWDKVLEVVFAAAKVVSSPIVEMIEESVNLYRKFLGLRESKDILESSIRHKQMFGLKGKKLITLSENFQIYSQCEMRHFTMLQFFEIFKDVIKLESNQLLAEKNSKDAWEK